MTGDGFCTTHKNGDDLGILHGIGFTYHIHAVILDLGYLSMRLVDVLQNSRGKTVSKIEPVPEVQKPKPKVGMDVVLGCGGMLVHVRKG